MHVVIVGAGTFGASLAWWLARSGDAVTLVEQFEPGDPRASSGGESRLLRSAHGPHADYTASARRARTLWRELEAESGEDLYLECGLTWFAQRDDAWEAQSIPVLAAQGIPYQRLAPDDGALLFPTWDPSGLRFLLHEPEAGVVRAQRAVQTLARQAAAHGATVLRGRATPDGAGARLEDGRVLAGDVVVWACGPWLPKLFPEHVPVRPVLAELFFLDGGPAWRDPSVPAFVDLDSAFYGTHDLDGLGVKMAPDFDGPPLDADAPLPPAGEERLTVTRKALASRFPALARRRCCTRRRAATSRRSTRTSSPPSTRSSRASGSWAAAPATASSTARRWPSGSRPPCAARPCCPGTSASAAASRATRSSPSRPTADAADLVPAG